MDELISTGWHWSYGWLRRPDLDEDHGYCYEEPDGDLVFTARRGHSVACYLECREDRESGERYLCFSRATNRQNLDRYGRRPYRVRES